MCSKKRFLLFILTLVVMALPLRAEGIAFFHGTWQETLVNPEKPDVPLNKNDAFQKVQKRHVQEKR